MSKCPADFWNPLRAGLCEMEQVPQFPTKNPFAHWTISGTFAGIIMEELSTENVVNHGAFLPYPVSTLSPKIVPNDLSTFKSRGISQVERDLQQKLVQMREEYIATIEHFNWNKLVYEAEINFEPTVGESYHLYSIRGKNTLSMIAPDQWPHEHLASFRLNLDRQWLLTEARVEARSLFSD